MTPTPIYDWSYGTCGIDADGDRWVRLAGGALRYTGRWIPYASEELVNPDPYTAIIDPDLTFKGEFHETPN